MEAFIELLLTLLAGAFVATHESAPHPHYLDCKGDE